ncbi:MAG: methyltransferase domain-containing protein [Burkholderiaceae bacterium]
MLHRVLEFGRVGRVSDYLKSMAPGVFLHELCAKPGIIGAICPSSVYLARNMARQIPRDGNGLVVELGGGTGSVTQALLNHGISPDRLVVVEFSSLFVQRLRKRFPHVNVVHGNAADLGRLLPPDSQVDAIVSSLPLCSLPEPMTQSILEQWRQLLHEGGVAVQFTYNLRSPKWRKHLQAQQIDAKIVWANLPPAKISTFSFKTAKLPTPHEFLPPEPPR